MTEVNPSPEEILAGAMGRFNPSHVFGLLSGGHDSLTVTHFAARYLGERLDAVVHINTGIGIRQTREFVRDTCQALGWPLLEYKATENTRADGSPDPQIYRDLVKEWGFPGPAQHGKMFARLKERQIRRLIRDHKVEGRKILLISGVRQEESSRRMLLGDTNYITEQGTVAWVNPFFFKGGAWVQDYLLDFNLPRNPVKEALCMSGECLCGAFAHPGELDEIRYHYPEAAREIESIERETRAAGFPWGWADRPPEWWLKMRASEKQGQGEMFAAELKGEIQMLCTSCEYHFEQEAIREAG